MAGISDSNKPGLPNLPETSPRPAKPLHGVSWHPVPCIATTVQSPLYLENKGQAPHTPATTNSDSTLQLLNKF